MFSALLEQTILVDFHSPDDKNNITSCKCTYNNMFEHPDEGEQQPRMETLYIVLEMFFNFSNEQIYNLCVLTIWNSFQTVALLK